MAAQYIVITLDEMEKYLKRAFRIMRPTQGQQRGELYYDLNLGPFVGVRVWTSIRPGSEVGAEVGADAIRVQFVSLKDNGPLEKGKAPIVKRTQGWRDSLKDRIEDLVEKYHENEDFWENWAGTRQRQADPGQALKQHEKEEKLEEKIPEKEKEEKTEPPLVSTPQAKAPLPSKYRNMFGVVTEAQLKYLRALLGRVNHQTWYSLNLNNISGFDHVPSKEELQTLSKAQASYMIDTIVQGGYGFEQRRRYAAQYVRDDGYDPRDYDEAQLAAFADAAFEDDF